MQRPLQEWRQERGEAEADRTFRFFVIAIGRPGDIQFLTDTTLASSALLDPEAKAFEAYDVRAIPQTFFVDRDGVIRENRLGWTGQNSVMQFFETVSDLTQP